MNLCNLINTHYNQQNHVDLAVEDLEFGFVLAVLLWSIQSCLNRAGDAIQRGRYDHSQEFLLL